MIGLGGFSWAFAIRSTDDSEAQLLRVYMAVDHFEELGHECKWVICLDVFEAIRTRRSVRGYEERPVTEKKVLKVLEAARLAPSAANRQPWTFVVVPDPEAKERLRAAYNRDWFVSSPVIIVACADPEIAWRGYSATEGRVLDGKEEY